MEVGSVPVKPEWLLVSDVDNTLLGDDAALVRFCEWLEAHRPRVLLAYASGRFIESIEASVCDTFLPEPDAIIGGVGSEISVAGCRLDGWPRNVEPWDRQTIVAELGGRVELQLQDDEFQSTYKVSYFGFDLDPGYLNDLKIQLERAVGRVNLIYSSNRDLDVLPAHTDKGAAAKFLAQYWGLDSDRVIVSGDSGNDLPLFRQGFRGVVVGNAHDDLRCLTGDRVYHSPLPFAAGVLDGVKQWMEITHSPAIADPNAGRGRL